MPIDSPFLVVLGLDRSSPSKVKQSVGIFAMKISDSEKQKPSKFDPLRVVDLPKSFYSAVLGSSLYICDSSNARTVQVFDIDPHAKTVKSRGSIPSSVSRYHPHTIVHDFKLYVLGGLKYPFLEEEKVKGNFLWMEVFDPVSEKWSSLPNPPVDICPYYMVTALCKSQNQIIVLTSLENRMLYAPEDFLLLAYDVRSGVWTSLYYPPVRKLFGGGRSSSANGAPLVDGVLYWVKLEDGINLDVDGYNLQNDQWLVGRLNIYQQILGVQEHRSLQ